jgi:hypothetical protein
MPSIRQFLYRLPRFKTEFPMDLILGDTVVLGVCVNLSESGLRGTFSYPLAAGTEGLLTLYHGDRSFQIHARIESIKADDARVKFRYDNDQEREDIRRFLKHLTPAPLWRR